MIERFKKFARGGVVNHTDNSVPAFLDSGYVVTTHQQEILLSGAVTEEAEETEVESWQFGGAEIFVPGSEVTLADDDQFIVKEIMRTGEWAKTPGSKGVIRKPLKVIRDGASSAKDSIVSMSELVTSFKDKAYPYVTIPLSDDQKDHKNLTGLNTGYVKDVWIEDKEDGQSVLKAKMHFTEEDVKGKVQRGTIPDVSAGVYFDVERPDGKKFDSAINHVCLTKNPFIDGMVPFGVLASGDDAEGDDDTPENIEGFVPAEVAAEKPDWDDRMSFSHQQQAVQEAINTQLGLSRPDDYQVTDIAPERAVITNRLADISWVAGFELTGDGLRLDPVGDWQIREKSVETEGSERREPAPAPEGIEASADDSTTETETSSLSPLQQAQESRRHRVRDDHANTEGGEVMGQVNTADPLAGLDLSDPDAVKERITALASDNTELRQATRSGAVGEKVEKLAGMLFSDDADDEDKGRWSGLLRVYRDILMSDDEQPAAVLLSHDDKGNVTARDQVTATEIADKIIAALPTEEKDGEVRIILAAQHTDTGNNERPEENDASDPLDNSPEAVERRTREQAEAIGKPLPASDQGKE